MSAFQELMLRLRQQLEAAEERVRGIKRAISAMEDAQRVLGPEALELLAVPLSEPDADQEHKRDRGILAPREVALAARQTLLDHGRPMKRGALVRELLKRNVPLAGKDKNKNLGTILWRHPDMFVAIDKLGYWVRDVAIPGVYDPDATD